MSSFEANQVKVKYPGEDMSFCPRIILRGSSHLLTSLCVPFEVTLSEPRPVIQCGALSIS